MRRLHPHDAHELLRAGALAVDVRASHELASGRIAGALHLPLDRVAESLSSLAPSKDRALLFYCASGVRSARAAELAEALGYAQSGSLEGGVDAWVAARLPLAEDGATPRFARYARQLRLPEIGVVGQEKLAAARVLLVGLGGLGSPVALYLAAAGVGTLGLCDPDVVSLSNLHRQILHGEGDVQIAKVDSAARALKRLDSAITLERHPLAITEDNALSLVSRYDVVVDGSDNFKTRYAVNDACVAADKPLVHAAIFRFDGQLAVFPGRRGPCYRCLFPSPPAPGTSPSCEEAGVLGVLPGIIGTMQALEALKILLGLGSDLVGGLLLVDTLGPSFMRTTIAKREGCAACGA